MTNNAQATATTEAATKPQIYSSNGFMIVKKFSIGLGFPLIGYKSHFPR